MLDADMIAIITAAFTDMKSTVAQIMTIAIPATIGVICLTAGANYALSKIRGILGWA